MIISKRNRVQNKVWQIIILAALVAAMTSPAFLYAQETPTHPRIGLVLSGGGARGAAHVGVLRVMEELHFPSTASWARAWVPSWEVFTLRACRWMNWNRFNQY